MFPGACEESASPVRRAWMLGASGPSSKPRVRPCAVLPWRPPDPAPLPGLARLLGSEEGFLVRGGRSSASASWLLPSACISVINLTLGSDNDYLRYGLGLYASLSLRAADLVLRSGQHRRHIAQGICRDRDRGLDPRCLARSPGQPWCAAMRVCHVASSSTGLNDPHGPRLSEPQQPTGWRNPQQEETVVRRLAHIDADLDHGPGEIPHLHA